MPVSLLLSFHHLSLSSTTPLHHHNNHHPKFPIFPKPLFSIQNPNPKLKPLNSHPSTTNTSTTNLEPAPKSAIQRIADKLRTLGFSEQPQTPNNDENPNPNSKNVGEIFIPNSRRIPNYRVGHTLDPSWSTPHNPVPDPGTGSAIARFHELKGVVKKQRIEAKEREKDKEERESVPSLAELALPRSEIRRLTTIGIRMKQKMKVGKAGITEGVVNGIHERWRRFEVVKIVCDDICRLNMKRTHDLLERKTGGMVVWRAGGKIILYRGLNYKYPYFSSDGSSVDSSQNGINLHDGLQNGQESQSAGIHKVESAGQSLTRRLGQSSLMQGVGSPSRVRLQLPGEKQLIEEADNLLDGLGPRFTDWWGCDPLPVDADLLPAVVPGYRKPFRLLPYGVKPKLTNDEMTVLKRLGRPLPCHFALGRNRNLQGLASAILKLWEKCEIAKVAVKRGVQNTNSELMAEELKRLTGGTLLSRDKEYVVFYRGKDFLPSAVSSAIEERRKSRVHKGEKSMNGSTTNKEDSISYSEGHVSNSGNETSKLERLNKGSREQKTKPVEAAIVRTSRKLSMALEEKAKAEKLLSELEQAEISRQAEIDQEGITEEERYMLRRVGLRMKPFLLLGRRGVFDGTIENMHLHWKYRELVKIICGGRNIDEIHSVARVLEAESGGILVAVERVSKGHAIIVYRGKNYQRPTCLRPQTLLNKKEALKRSIEAQRRQSLKLNVLKLSRNIEELKLKLVEEKDALATREGDKLNCQVGLTGDEPTPTVSDECEDSQDGNLSSVQQGKLIDNPSLHAEAGEISDKCSASSVCFKTSSSSVLKEQPSTGVSRCNDDREASRSKMTHIASSNSGNASGNNSVLNSTFNESEPLINLASEDISDDHHTCENEIVKPAKESDNKGSVTSAHKAAENNSPAVPSRARPLTNKERLLLRRQALKMQKRPVLAVGKSNVVTGVAKAIKDHFKKHPLAIVNVKGRAKGTSVQEVVFQLEQATGAVLVSQEPSKIILYRGWGGGVKTGYVDGGETIEKQAGPTSLAVSPELLAAMRLECGLSIK